MSNKVQVLLAFLAGALIGTNWVRIRKIVYPCLGAAGKKVTGVYNRAVTFREAEKEVTTFEPMAVAAEPKTVEQQILSILKDNPKGKTLTEIAAIIGVHFVKLAMPMKKLISEDKVRKEEKRYLLS